MRKNRKYRISPLGKVSETKHGFCTPDHSGRKTFCKYTREKKEKEDLSKLIYGSAIYGSWNIRKDVDYHTENDYFKDGGDCYE